MQFRFQESDRILSDGRIRPSTSLPRDQTLFYPETGNSTSNPFQLRSMNPNGTNVQPPENNLNINVNSHETPINAHQLLADVLFLRLSTSLIGSIALPQEIRTTFDTHQFN
ncbi:unnamed protein product [Adineta ricciae]|uniref:Uncharacterized protein n=1 Tax=Adineta ricciae TaxID=249248 RepID=A0A815WBW9_ADIRI|nr:unnamed protein product [Adineta ricciae]